MRNKFISTLLGLARVDPRITIVAADIGGGVLEPFRDELPDQFVDVGIAEQNAVGVAAGLALSGRIPYFYTIVPFATARPFEQIQVDVSYMETNVRIVGVGSGFSYGAQGATHHGITDISLMRALPNMRIMAPCGTNEAASVARISTQRTGPMYIRLGSTGEPDYGYDDIEFGRLKQLRSASVPGNPAIIATGAIMTEALLAADELDADLYSAHTLKPFDAPAIERLIDAGAPIVTVEEHNIIGGLASIVSEIIARRGKAATLIPFAVPDRHSHFIGDQSFIRARFGLTDLATEIRAKL